MRTERALRFSQLCVPNPPILSPMPQEHHAASGAKHVWVVPRVNPPAKDTHKTSGSAQSCQGNLRGCQLTGRIILLPVNVSDCRIKCAIAESHYTISSYFWREMQVKADFEITFLGASLCNNCSSLIITCLSHAVPCSFPSSLRYGKCVMAAEAEPP